MDQPVLDDIDKADQPRESAITYLFLQIVSENYSGRWHIKNEQASSISSNYHHKYYLHQTCTEDTSFYPLPDEENSTPAKELRWKL
jgi:hypothetical protein